MSNFSLGHNEQKVNYMKFVQRFVAEIEVKITNDLFDKGHIFKLVNFNENGLKLFRLSYRFRKG